MRSPQRVVRGLSCLLLLALTVQAQAANGWLEKLSGPGHFHGWVVPALPIWCSGTERLDGFACLGHPESDEFFMVTLVPSFLDSTKNDLEYDPTTPSDRKKVSMTSWSVLVNWRVDPLLDIGVGGGFSSFSGDLFPTFRRPVVDPLRAVIRPLGLFYRAPTRDLTTKQRLYRDLLQINVGLVYYPTGFDADDFGAIPGTYSESLELLWSASITIDLSALW